MIACVEMEFNSLGGLEIYPQAVIATSYQILEQETKLFF